MSGTAETEMQIQIVIHGEAFCPSMMTTETPFANRKLLLEEITNNERNGIEEEQMEEIEIKEGHDDVEEEQDNKAKENPFVNQKLLLEEITNNERNDMEEGQMEENEIKEGHEDVEEEQDNEIKLPINNNVTRSAWSASETTIILHPVQHYDKAVKMLKVKAMQEELRQLWFAVFAQFAQKTYQEINKMQLEEQKNPWQKENEGSYLDEHFDLECDSLTKETPFANRKLLLEEITNNERNEMEEGQMKENEIIEGHEDVEEEQDNKAKETPIANRKVLLEGGNEMEEGQMKEIEIKEGHEDVGEKQDKKFLNFSDYLCKTYTFRRWYWVPYTCDFLMKEGQMEEFNKKESQKKERKQAFEEMKIRRLEIENFWKHALEKDMDIMRILKSGPLRFLKQQIQDLLQLLRCKVCLDSDACMVYFPCRHMATCEYCGSFLDQCPVCRTFIEKTVKVNKK